MAKKQLNAPPVAEMKPMLYLSGKDLPEIKDWEVGNEYTLLVRVKQTSKSIHEYDKEKNTHADFEIINIRAVDASDSSKDFKQFEKAYTRKG